MEKIPRSAYIEPVYNEQGIDDKAITWALEALQKKSAEYALARDYYSGKHKLDFVTEKFKSAFGQALQAMKVNYCPTVVNTVADRLQINTFSAHLKTKKKAGQKVIDAAVEIWEMNRMAERALNSMREGLKCGDAYIIVWPDPEIENDPVLYPQDAGTCAVQYHAEKPGYIIRAAKWWRTIDKKIRLTVYYADRIEKYITSQEVEKLPEKATDFVKYEVKDGSGEVREAWPLHNPYGKCPVFHLENDEGISELANIIEPQNVSNLTFANLLVAMEFFAFPQRYATGIEVDDDDASAMEQWKAAMDRLWYNEHPEGKFGQFDPASPSPYLEVLTEVRNEIAIIAGIPPHYFEMRGGDIPSGVALQILEARLSQKIKKRQIAWGNVWADVMRLALQMKGIATEGMRLKCEWHDTEPHDAKAEAETQEVKQRTGVSKKQSLREQGYSDDQIEEMKQDRDEESASAGAMMGSLFNKGQV